MSGRSEVLGRIKKLSSSFNLYLTEYDKRPPFGKDQLKIHRKVISRRRELGSAESAINSDQFLAELRELLEKWGMNRRGARLVDLESFKSAIRSKVQEISSLESHGIGETAIEFKKIIPKITEVIQNLGINDNYAKVVVGTKTLHHLLPNLIPPIDRVYTGRFFSWPGNYFQYNQALILREALTLFNDLARMHQPERLVGEDWRTSETKILDNAIVGYCMVEKLPYPS